MSTTLSSGFRSHSNLSTSATALRNVDLPHILARPSSQLRGLRSSASLIVVNSRNEVLLAQRNPESRSFAGVHLFPGGNFDEKQDGDIGLCAIRETFEETGLLLASPCEVPESPPLILESVLDAARSEIHAQNLKFKNFLLNYSLVPHVNALLPFTQWITPPNVPRRYQTNFFVSFLPAVSSFGFNSGIKDDFFPKPDGSREVLSARFVHPKDALTEFHEHKITLMPPQVYLLSTLADILHGYENTSGQRNSIEELSKGAFGRMVMNPHILTVEGEGKGWTTLVYEGDEAFTGPKGQLHRMRVKFDKNGITSNVVLERNFNILSGMEIDIPRMSSNL